MAQELTADLVLDAHATLGEGPVWDADGGVLWWVDIEGRRIHRFDPATSADTSFETASMVTTGRFFLLGSATAGPGVAGA